LNDKAGILFFAVIAGAVILAGGAAAAYANIPMTDGDGNPVVDDNGNMIFIPVPNEPIAYPQQSTDENLIMPDTTDYTLDQKVSALMAVIRRYESNNNYLALVGGGSFYNTSRHPAALNAPHPDGWVLNSSGSNYFNPARNSSAAGAYQITYPTYMDVARTMGITNFTPESQDILAYELLGEVGAIIKLNNNDIPRAFNLASKRWASLPGSTAKQNPISMQTALTSYNSALALA